jgi:MFS transporter, ACS family, tartrate transporter
VPQSELENRTIRKAALRLLPLLMVAYLTAYVNRVNIGFALTMQADLGLSATVYGFGAGLFFISYFLAEVPSNLILERVGARRWIARIMFTWGLLAMSMALVSGATSFMIVRFLLGIAEAGYYPGVMLYLAFWFPAAYRARMMAWFSVGIPVSLAITGPLSNLILDNMGGLLGLKDWQWLFIVEGLPTLVLGTMILCFLPDKPASARWLTPEERTWLQRRIDGENSDIANTHSTLGLMQALMNPRTLALSFVYFTNVACSYGVGFFLPQIIKAMGTSNSMANYLTSLPFLAGIASILVFGEISDRFKSRRKAILAFCIAITAVGLSGAAAVGPNFAAIALIGIAAIGTYGCKAPFWPLPSMFLTGRAAAAGIGLISAIGNLGGFIGPYVTGWARDATGGYAAGLYLLSGLAVAGALVAALIDTPSYLPDKARKNATHRSQEVHSVASEQARRFS